MAVDEALLAAAADDGVATLRFYQWSEPTLSLGYFQRYADRERHEASRNSAAVRRQTGGGAIIHDRELTYSLALPAIHPLARENQRLYTAVHRAFINLLKPLVTASSPPRELALYCETSALETADEPFLCFARRARGDVLVVPISQSSALSATADPTWKILGSAQRRQRGAILQHGSLLLESSPAAPELLGLRDLTGVLIDVPQLANSLAELIGDSFGVSMHKMMLSNEMRSRARQIERAKYGLSGWTKRR